MLYIDVNLKQHSILLLITLLSVQFVTIIPVSAQQDTGLSSELKYNNIVGFMQIKINDSNGNLVGYLETSKIRILDNEAVDTFFDGWQSKYEIVINDITYTVLEFKNESVITEKFWTGRTGIPLSALNLGIDLSIGSVFDPNVIYAAHPQFLINKGDVLKIILSVVQPIT